ncbi:meprin A subunit beta-like [Odontesthes bonariensis]|uniref:meprin A subunit beta-like n=1 Tax=Odontesthes bonariensis TaxID=219752 RepID=UPI003F584B91
MMMKCFFFFMVSRAVLSAVLKNQNGLKIVDIGEELDIAEANKAFLYNDTLMPVNTQRSGSTVKGTLWTPPVPYEFDEDLELNARGIILKAFDSFRLKSCIDFTPRVSEDYYISVQKLNGCSSVIGKVVPNGQVISIGRDCASIDIVEHEILHALGFHHEQSRYDRDTYVTIVKENIIEGKENNFKLVENDHSTTHVVPYDHWSVMHYPKNMFSNGNGPTIITKDPKFQDVIGQTLGMSPLDVLELNLLYKCNSTIAFLMYCGFSNGTLCQISCCSQSGNGWEVVTRVYGGPNSDHTSLPSGNSEHGKVQDQDTGYFMHVSTASGQEGDSARLETQMMNPKRGCHVQCLQFYYYNSGNESDVLNIWIREFQDDQDSSGTLRLMGQITGALTSHWKLQHVSLNAIKQFQVVFEVRKGAGSSTGGFSIDDINLSETECPHLTLQIDDFEKLLNTSADGTRIYSPRQYSNEGYAFRIVTILRQTFFGLYFHIISGDYDDQLEWPCLQRQITFQILDQSPNIQLQMSKQRSFITDETQLTSDGVSYWNNPHETGYELVDENDEFFFAGTLFGFSQFASLEDMQQRDFLRGGSAIFILNFQGELNAFIAKFKFLTGKWHLTTNNVNI